MSIGTDEDGGGPWLAGAWSVQFICLHCLNRGIYLAIASGSVDNTEVPFIACE